jgi:phage gpG-like protein
MSFSLGSFGAHLAAIAITTTAHEKKGLEKAAVIIETEAKRVIGTYDYGWLQLAESTLAQKSANTPLLETGEMRDSIEHTHAGRSAFVGSNSDIAVYQELGTAKIPARSFLAGAAIHKGKEAAQAVAGEMLLGLIKP